MGLAKVEGQPHRGAPGIRTTAKATGSQAGDSLDGLAPMPVLSAHAIAIKKSSGPSSVLKLVPTKTKSFHLQRRA